MDRLWPFIVFPAIGALIGWCTNWLAVKMIFRPRRAFRVLGFEVQGLLPKRRRELAENVAATVERDLLSAEQIQDLVKSLVKGERVRELLHERVDRLIDEQIAGLGPMVAAFVSGDIVDKIKRRLEEEVMAFVDSLSQNLHADIGEHIDIQEMVRTRMEGFDLDKLEEIVFRIAAAELRHIEVLGGVLGLIIGLTEAVLAMVL